MGGTIKSKEVQTFVRDENDNLVLDGSATTIFTLQLEDSLGGGAIRQENPIGRIAHLAMEDSVDNASIALENEDGNLLPEEDGDSTDISQSEVFGDSILLERSTLSQGAGQTSATIGGILVQDENDKVLIDRAQETNTVAKLLFDATLSLIHI